MHFAVSLHLIVVKSKITAQILKCVCLPCNWATQLCLYYTEDTATHSCFRFNGSFSSQTYLEIHLGLFTYLRDDYL